MIERKDWTQNDWLVYLEGWSFERLGYPKPPAMAGLDNERSVRKFIDTLNSIPDAMKASAIKDALKKQSPSERVGMFFDFGRIEARSA